MKFCKLGIPIAEIALHGQYSVKENLVYTDGLGSEDLDAFTICSRFNVQFLRPTAAHILSYSTFIHANSLISWLKIYSDGKLAFIICKYLGFNKVTGVCSKKSFKSVRIHDQWHHFCWLFNVNGIDSDQIKVSTNLYFDGKEETQGTIPSFNSFFMLNI